VISALIVQSGQLLVLAAAAAHRSRASIIPVIIILLVVLVATRARSRRRGQRAAGATSGPARRPRSARGAMRSDSAHRDSDTEPRDGTPGS
jgi:hypothetical protein